MLWASGPEFSSWYRFPQEHPLPPRAHPLGCRMSRKHTAFRTDELLAGFPHSCRQLVPCAQFDDHAQTLAECGRTRKGDVSHTSQKPSPDSHGNTVAELGQGPLHHPPGQGPRVGIRSTNHKLPTGTAHTLLLTFAQGAFPHKVRSSIASPGAGDQTPRPAISEGFYT